MLTALLLATSNGFDQASFTQFVDMRVGKGKPVYWYCTGELYSFPEGKLLAKMDGVDVARLLPVKDKTKATQLSRKVFRYLDPESGKEIGGEVKRIEYPYQWMEYDLAGSTLKTTVTQGKGARIQKLTVDQARCRPMEDGTVFSVPLFVSVTTPRGKLDAYENYDFFVVKGRPHRLSWNRFSDLPPGFGPGKGVMQMVARRFDRLADLPSPFVDFLRKDAPLWLEPPKDLKEIGELQK